MNARVLVYLGTILYGIYMFYPLVINLLLKPCSQLPTEWMNLALTMVLPITVAVSAVSYKLYGKPFLDLKKRLRLCGVRRS